MLRWSDLVRMLVVWAVSALALAASVRLLPGLRCDSFWPLIGAAAVTGAVGLVVRPILAWIAAVIGWLGVAVVAFAGQAVVIQLALSLVRGIEVSGFWPAVAAAWISAAVITVLIGLLTAGTPESLVASLRRRRPVSKAPADGLDGMVFVQLDGVPYPLVRWAITAGLMPTVRRWLDDDTHVLREWIAQLPCTTPASQLGILHGRHDGVPAFRWFDRELGRVLVANHPPDARVIEERGSDGAGLLADDGVTVSALFSGDAVQSSMVMSKVEPSRGSFRTRHLLAGFMARPDGLARSLNRAVAEVARERFEAGRQRRREVWPRITRPWQFAGLRAVTNSLLRDLNVAVVADAMNSGRRSIYVNFVDFDEVAHHAGAVRLDSLAVLESLDTIIDGLTRIAENAGRRYHFVLLSDHGQSLGAPFAVAHGEDIGEVCRRLMETPVDWIGRPVESNGRVRSIADDVATGSGIAAAVAARSLRSDSTGATSQDHTPVVLGSGNLGLLYSGGPDRLSTEDLAARWPALIPGLAAHPGVEFVAGVSAAEGPIAFGANGRHHLATGEIVGADPLANLPSHSSRVLRAALEDPLAPDLYLNGAMDPDTSEVCAFENLVGSHGGLGGDQDRGLVIAPTELWRATEPIHGAAALHEELVAMLVALGHRGSVAAREDEESA